MSSFTFDKLSWSFGIKTRGNVQCNVRNGICCEKDPAENPSIVQRVKRVNTILMFPLLVFKRSFKEMRDG